MSEEIIQPVAADPNPPAVEPVAPAVEVTDPAPVELTPDAGADPQKGGVQKRIDELVKQREDAKREADFYRAMAQQGQPQPQAAPEAPVAPEQPPKVEDFSTYEEHQDALIAYKVRQATAAERQKQTAAQQRAQQEQNRVEFQRKAAEFAQQQPDYVQKVMMNNALPITADMADAIELADNGPQIAYYLANNVGEAARIAALPQRAQAMEIGRVSATMAPQKPKPTSAPPPVQPLAGGDAPPEKEPTDPAEWLKWRERRVQSKGLR